jgi:CHAD domain-containing protein
VTDSQAKIGEAARALCRKRLERFAALVPRVVVGGDEEAIHDARVASRRAQEILKLLGPGGAKKSKHRKLIRALRDTRRVLGGPRNLDVMLKLVETKLSRSGNPVARDGWDQFRSFLKERRARAFERASDELREFDVLDFAARCRRVIARSGGGGTLDEALNVGAETALAQWREAIAAAKANPNVEEVHRLRIAGKRLRYRLEVLAELGEETAKKRVKSVRALQDQLGTWHDSEVLLSACAEFLSRREFLASYPGPARALLVEMDRERRRADGAVEELVKHAEKASQAFAEPNAASAAASLGVIASA